MEVPKVINELIRSYMWAIEHPVCKLLQDARKRLRDDHEKGRMPHPEIFAHPHCFHADSFFPYETHSDQYGVSRHFYATMSFDTLSVMRSNSESFYCHRCGESYTELSDSVIERCTCFQDYSEI